MGAFDGKVVIVTGGALGIGKATALAFAAAGAAVAIADVNETAGSATVEAIQAAGGQALLVVGDLANASVCQQVVRQTVGRFNRLDILFNNVGIQPQASYANVEDTTEEMWDAIVDVNLKSYFLMSKYAIPSIRKQGGGAIVNTASVQGLQSQRLVPAYAASKGGVLSLTRQMALDYAREHIRVLAVCPGTIDTEMVRASAAREPDGIEEALERYGKSHPLGRIGQGQDIANVVLFLASEQASFMTGEYVCVDGGYNALGAWDSNWGDR
jgi:NAD(P)-dependent dehydrogenase (short-subunit alcohol dehydrogenase family)